MLYINQIWTWISADEFQSINHDLYERYELSFFFSQSHWCQDFPRQGYMMRKISRSPHWRLIQAKGKS